MSGKRVLILGAGRGQTELIGAVKRLGHTAVVASIKGDYPGFALADEISYTDISDKEAVAETAERLGVGAAATSCIDVGIESLGYICEKFGFPGPSGKVGAISANKLLMKEEFERLGIPSPRYRTVRSRDDLISASRELTYPLIVKAVDLQGSRGITIVRSPGELDGAFDSAMSQTRADCCIVEEFITGSDCGAQAFVRGGEILFVLPTGNVSFHGATNIPVGHYVPLDAPAGVLAEIDRVCRETIVKLGFDDCAVNFDLIVADGRVCVIELTARLGANCLPELINERYGVNIYDVIAATAAGEDLPGARFDGDFSGCVYARMILPTETGILDRIEDRNAPDPDILDISFFVGSGDEVSRFGNSRDCAGQVIVKGSSLEACEKLADDVIDNISLVLKK